MSSGAARTDPMYVSPAIPIIIDGRKVKYITVQ
jgi:hypothetical protein